MNDTITHAAISEDLVLTRLLGWVRSGIALKILSWALMGLLLWITVLYSLAVPGDPDLGWHHRYGEYFLTTGKIVDVDIFNHANWGHPGSSNAWLMEVIHVILYNATGFWGLIILSSATILAAYLLPLILVPGTTLGKLIAVPLAMFISWPVLMFGQRPQNFTILGVSLVLTLLLLYRNRGAVWTLYFLPPLFLLWVNFHGGFYAGYAILGLFILLEALRSFLRWVGFLVPYVTTGPLLTRRQLVLLTGIFGACFLAGLLKPGGGSAFGVIITILGLIRQVILPSQAAAEVAAGGVTRVTVLEWMPIAYHTTFGYLYIASVILMVLFLLLFRRRVTITEVLIVIAFGYLASTARRHLPLFGVVSMPILIAQLSAFKSFGLPRLWRTLLVLGVVVVTLGLLIPATTQRVSAIAVRVANEESYFISWGYPYRAVQWVKENQEQLAKVPRPKIALDADQTGGARNPKYSEPIPDVPLMFNYYDWGGYLIWQLPEYPVFMDGRIPGSKAYFAYQGMIMGVPNWEKAFDAFGVSWTLLPPNVPINAALERSGAWDKVYNDEKAVIFLRKTSPDDIIPE